MDEKNEFKKSILFKVGTPLISVAALWMGLMFISFDDEGATIFGLLFILIGSVFGYIYYKLKDYYVRIDSSGISTNSVSISWDNIKDINVDRTRYEYVEITYAINENSGNKKIQLSSIMIGKYDQMKRILLEGVEIHDGTFEKNAAIRNEIVDNELIPAKAKIKKNLKIGGKTTLLSIALAIVGVMLDIDFVIGIGFLLFMPSLVYTFYQIYRWFEIDEKHEMLTGKQSKTGRVGSTINTVVYIFIFLFLVILRVALG